MNRSEAKGALSDSDNGDGDLEFARKRSEWFSSGRGRCAVRSTLRICQPRQYLRNSPLHYLLSSAKCVPTVNIRSSLSLQAKTNPSTANTIETFIYLWSMAESDMANTKGNMFKRQSIWNLD